MASRRPEPQVDDCPLCGRPVSERPHAPEYCDACGCLLVEWSRRHDADDVLPPGVTRRPAAALTGGDARGAYRVAAEETRLDILVAHRQQRFRAAAVSAAVVLVGIVTRGELPAAMMAGIAAIAIGGIGWSLIPRTASMRFVATPNALTVVADGVPIHHGQRFAAEEVEGVFVRALARAERVEDRRLELVLLDRHGRQQPLLRGLDDPRALAWIATHIEQALGFEELPEHRSP